jgi:hypothetical protein
MYPFFYFYDLEFDVDKMLDFIGTIPDDKWFSPHIGNYDKSVEIGPHIYDDLLWTASSAYVDFTKSDEMVKILNYFNEKTKLINKTAMLIKKTKKGFSNNYHPLLQNVEFDKKCGWVRTFDIIVPIIGGFEQNPLQAWDTKTGEEFFLNPIGKAFMVPSDPSWHYRWEEHVCDFRYTLHLRGFMPNTYDFVKSLYYKDV